MRNNKKTKKTKKRIYNKRLIRLMDISIYLCLVLFTCIMCLIFKIYADAKEKPNEYILLEDEYKSTTYNIYVDNMNPQYMLFNSYIDSQLELLEFDSINTDSDDISNSVLLSENYENEEDQPKIINYECDIKGYVTANLNVRQRPNTESEILDTLRRYTVIHFSYIENNDEWVVIKYNDKYSYLSKKYIEEGEIKFVSKPVVSDRRKSYMDWTTITNKRSKQWKLQNEYCTTGSTGIRMYDGRYCIALGSYYTHRIGQYVDLVLENGTIIPCIIGDAKQDIHTTDNNSVGLDGGVAEFIVDTKSLPHKSRRMGDVSFNDYTWKSNVVEVRIFDKSLF